MERALHLRPLTPIADSFPDADLDGDIRSLLNNLFSPGGALGYFMIC